MSKTNQPASSKSKKKIRRDHRLIMEQLEERRMLSIGGPPAPFSLDEIVFDPESYSADSIIVRFNQNIESLAAIPSPGNAPRVFSGAKAETKLTHVPGLYKIALSSGVEMADALATYRNDPRVAYAEPNYRIRIADTYPNDTRFSEMWPLDNNGQTGGVVDADIDAPRAWDVTQGSGSITIAVIDTGVDYTHPDLAQNMWINSGEIPGDGLDNDDNGYVDDVYGYDFANRDSDPMDDQGHGTHIAGTIGAEGNNGLGVTGIIWDVQIMALKFLDQDGWGLQSDAIEAINYAIANGASITNASWGGDPYSQALYDAITAARDADHVIVAAAGNGNSMGIGQDNDTTLFYPASYDLDNIVAVAAHDAGNALGSFSNYGHTTVDLAAPGVSILSTMPGGSYGMNNGTSMAAPHVAGVLALVRDQHPEWTYHEAIDQVLSTVDPIPEFYGLVATSGRLNAAAAVGNPEPDSGSPPSSSLPVEEDFSDGAADSWIPQAGSWSVGGGEYTPTPVVQNHELGAVSTLNLTEPLPDQFEIEATVNANQGHQEIFGIVLSDHLTNGFIVFDYHNPEDFKFAGADMDGDRWIIGHRDTDGWSSDAWTGENLHASTDYQLLVTVTNEGEVRLEADGVAKLAHQFVDDLVDGEIGLGMRDSTTHFDNIRVEETFPESFGPALVSIGPSTSQIAPVNSVTLLFSEPIDASSVTLDDIIEFTGPSGSITPLDIVEVSGSGSLEFNLSFPSQTEIGEYSLVLGPQILDLDGNPMNQDLDEINGEAIEDQGQAAFHVISLAARFDFGMSSTPVATGYTGVLETDLYSGSQGYGWQSSISSFDRFTSDPLLSDFHYGASGTFLTDVSSGRYEVIVTMGDQGYMHDQMAVSLEGTQVDVITTQAGEYAIRSYLVDVSDGQLTLDLTDQGGANPTIVINALELFLVDLWPDLTSPYITESTPSGMLQGDFDRIELTFSEAIDVESFMASDATLVGPNGSVDPLTVTTLGDNRFEISFATQSEIGEYQLTIGPDITDLAGNALTSQEIITLTVVPPPIHVGRYDFGSSGTRVASDYTGVLASDLYNAARGYGWQSASLTGFDRFTTDLLLSDFHYGPSGTFLMDVQDGQYEVVISMGDEGWFHDQMAVSLEGTQVDVITTQAGEYAVRSYLVDVSDGQLTLDLTDQGGDNPTIVINALDVIQLSAGTGIQAVGPTEESSLYVPDATTSMTYREFSQGSRYKQSRQKFFSEFTDEDDLLEAEWLDLLANINK
jgi:subtilisin family serine protease/fibronectin type 3 domain-containing protein